MGRRRINRASAPRLIQREREEPYIPKIGPGQIFIEEGADEHRHFRNVGDPLDKAREDEAITPGLFDVGHNFRVIYSNLHRSGTDSTQALNVIGGGAGAGYTQTQAEAGLALARLRERMSGRDYRIIEKFCGEAIPMAEAVQRVTPCHPSNIKYRIIEALESLEDAFDSLRIRAAS